MLSTAISIHSGLTGFALAAKAPVLDELFTQAWHVPDDRFDDMRLELSAAEGIRTPDATVPLLFQLRCGFASRITHAELIAPQAGPLVPLTESALQTFEDVPAEPAEPSLIFSMPRQKWNEMFINLLGMSLVGIALMGFPAWILLGPLLMTLPMLSNRKVASAQPEQEALPAESSPAPALDAPVSNPLAPYRQPAISDEKNVIESTIISPTSSLPERLQAIRQSAQMAHDDMSEDLAVSFLLEFVEEPKVGRASLLGISSRHQYDLLLLQAYTAIREMLPSCNQLVLRQVLKFFAERLKEYPDELGLVRLHEDWSAEMPQRVAPYLLDLDRPVRQLMSDILQEARKNLVLNPEDEADAKLLSSFDDAQASLTAIETKLQEQLAVYEPGPVQFEGLAKLRNSQLYFNAVLLSAPLTLVIGLLFGTKVAFVPLTMMAGLVMASKPRPGSEEDRQEIYRIIAARIKKHEQQYLALGITSAAPALSDDSKQPALEARADET